MIHGQYGNDDWDLLSQFEKEGILEGTIEDLKKIGGIKNETDIQN